MSNPSRDKGLAYEAQIRDYLRSLGFSVERVPPGMREDRGDLSGLIDWTIQIKCYPRDLTSAIRVGLADLDTEQANAHTPYGALIVKRPRVTDPGSQLVVQELWQWGAVLQRMRSAAA